MRAPPLFLGEKGGPPTLRNVTTSLSMYQEQLAGKICKYVLETIAYFLLQIPYARHYYVTATFDLTTFMYEMVTFFRNKESHYFLYLFFILFCFMVTIYTPPVQRAFRFES